MAKKVVVDKNVSELRKALKGKFLIGAQAGLKNLKLGNVEVVFLASNCKEDVREEVEKLSKLSKVKIIDGMDSKARILIQCQLQAGVNHLVCP